MWFVYILECKDGSLYTGITNDFERRFLEHKNKVGAKYTKSHTVKKCVFKESSPTRSDAQKREAEIKKLTRAQKLVLVKNYTKNPNSRKTTS
ncbi:MAG: GIY-YIG nuclease family protein [Candidatus Pacebacteria bacterium]|nr:GIY-YIG nuclease family protein [Candidatus Paceibacterota bacterium]